MTREKKNQIISSGSNEVKVGAAPLLNHFVALLLRGEGEIAGINIILLVCVYFSSYDFPIIKTVVDPSLQLTEIWINSKHIHSSIHTFGNLNSPFRAEWLC